MAKGKSVKAQWVCQETKMTSGIFSVNKDKLKELPKRKKYHPKLRKRTEHVAKEAK